MRSIAPVVVCLFVVACLRATPAAADDVTFGTTATQLCVGASGCGVASQTIGGSVTVAFNPSPSQTVNAPSFVSLGDVVVSCVGGGVGCGSMSLAGLRLYINVSQTVPSAGNGSLVGGVMTGIISGTAANASVAWSTPNALAIGAVTYQLTANPIPVLPPSTGAGVMRIAALVTDVPPTTTTTTTTEPPTTTAPPTTTTTVPPACPDADADGAPDTLDRCADTPDGAAIDDAGCSQVQFCAGFVATSRDAARRCKRADWRNDEPVMKPREADCTVQGRKAAAVCAATAGP